MPNESNSQRDETPSSAGSSDDGAPTGLEAAMAAPIDPQTDPGPGERSGLSSRIAEELLDDGLEAIGADAATSAAPERAVEIDDPARAVGDDPENPIHGTLRQEFEAR